MNESKKRVWAILQREEATCRAMMARSYEIAPVNPLTDKPYFTVNKSGGGTDWSSNYKAPEVTERRLSETTTTSGENLESEDSMNKILSHQVSPTCPYCTNEVQDAWELNFGPGLDGTVFITCSNCKKEYRCERETTVYYRSIPLQNGESNE